MNARPVNSIAQTSRQAPVRSYSTATPSFARQNETSNRQPITGSTTGGIEIPILGGLFWVSPLNYQLIEQVTQILFAVFVIVLLKRIADKK